MAISTNQRDYDLARTVEDYERRISFLERHILRLAYLTPEFTAAQGCRVTRNAVQSIPNATFTTVNFNTEIFDNNSMHDNAVNNSRITINVAGLYVVGFGGEIMGGNDYVRTIASIRRNGGNSIMQSQFPGTSTSVPQRVGVNTMYQFAAGDYVEVQVFQQNTATAARDLTLQADYSPVFFAGRIGS